MSASRGNENVFAEGHERSCRRYINSKQASKLFIVCFLQRRLNTSYSKRLWWQRRRSGGGWVVARERWEYNPGGYAQSTIELVLKKQNRADEVIGRCAPDGSVWLSSNAVYAMPRAAHRAEVNAYLTRFYVHEDLITGVAGVKYRPLQTALAQPTVAPQPVAHTDSFTEVLNREWHV